MPEQRILESWYHDGTSRGEFHGMSNLPTCHTGKLRTSDTRRTGAEEHAESLWSHLRVEFLPNLHKVREYR